MVGLLVLLRNSARDGRKGDKMSKRLLGPYRLTNTTTGIFKNSEEAGQWKQVCTSTVPHRTKKS